MLISQANKDIFTALRAVGYYHPTHLVAHSRLFAIPSSLASLALSTIINHPTFFPEFLELNKTRLVEHYVICTNFLKKYSIPYIPSNAGFFIWIDLSAYLANMPGDSDLEKERHMTGKLLDAGIHLATSESFRGEDHGWFRITFTADKVILQVGMQRMVDTIGAKVREGDVTDGINKLDLQN